MWLPRWQQRSISTHSASGVRQLRRAQTATRDFDDGLLNDVVEEASIS
jgi:hypothetical protein